MDNKQQITSLVISKTILGT